MSRQNKMAKKAARAAEVTAKHKRGEKMGRTKKLHKKIQIYPKVRYSGFGANPKDARMLG